VHFVSRFFNDEADELKSSERSDFRRSFQLDSNVAGCACMKRNKKPACQLI